MTTRGISPITPARATQVKTAAIPDFVIDSFNLLIEQNFNGTQATFKQKNVVATIIARSPQPITDDEVYSRRWLDVEELYRAVGWCVDYDKPAYNETYDATFTFRAPRTK